MIRHLRGWSESGEVLVGIRTRVERETSSPTLPSVVCINAFPLRYRNPKKKKKKIRVDKRIALLENGFA